VAERPACPKCGNVMRLVWIASNKENQDRLAFECPACKNNEVLIVQDPTSARSASSR
jgi:DNA-directed RNA polymerase subunit M/transcription elongation factor TFIIS